MLCVFIEMNNLLNLLFAAFVLFSVESVSGNANTRIVGGDNAPAEFGKYHASIQNLTGYHVCGGAVISKWLVVTAAHCVDGSNPDYMKIVAGTNHLTTGGEQYDVSDIIVYDNYIPTTRENDIALLKTKKPFDLRYIFALKISRTELVEGDEVFIIGFGAQEPSGLSSYNMQKLDIKVFNQEICEYALRYASTPVTKEMFCTFSSIGQGTCHGDSGSPVLNVKNELVGVVSWGIPCAAGFPDVHTRITLYIDWIDEQIVKAHCEPPVLTIFERLEEISRYTPNVSEGLKKLLEKKLP